MAFSKQSNAVVGQIKLNSLFSFFFFLVPLALPHHLFSSYPANPRTAGSSVSFGNRDTEANHWFGFTR